MKRFIILAAPAIAAFVLLVLLVTQASAQTLYADPYPPAAVQPDGITFTVNGGSPIACVLAAVAAGKEPRCPLTSVTVPGTYTLVMTAANAGGSASSAPFVWNFLGRPPLAPSTLRVAP